MVDWACKKCSINLRFFSKEILSTSICFLYRQRALYHFHIVMTSNQFYWLENLRNFRKHGPEAFHSLEWPRCFTFKGEINGVLVKGHSITILNIKQLALQFSFRSEFNLLLLLTRNDNPFLFKPPIAITI